jgi:3-(3-hydroxy-phenyl)propionate hydroxylase
METRRWGEGCELSAAFETLSTDPNAGICRREERTLNTLGAGKATALKSTEVRMANPTQAIDAEVIVVGAGPTGLLLANFLGKAGVKTIVLERNSSTVREPRAVSIDDEALRAMQWLGLEEELIATLSLDYGSHYFDRRGVRFATIEPSETEHGYPKRNAFEQIKLEQILLHGVKRFPVAAVHFESEVTGFRQADDRVTLHVLSKLHDTHQVLSARWVVGCDGGRSTLRSLLNVDLVGNTYAEKWLIVDLDTTLDKFRQSRVICDAHRPCITLPGPNGIRRYEFMINATEREVDVVDESRVRELLASVGPDERADIRRIRSYTFHARVAARWRDGRILLAGDAAHLSPPFAGQGLNSGLRDAVNLGWKLPGLVFNRFATKLLDTYETERKPHVIAMNNLSLRMGEILMSKNRLRAALTPWFFRALSLFPKARDYVQQMRYRPRPRFEKGFLVPKGKIGCEVLGRQFPQPRVELPDRRYVLLDHLLGDGFAIIALSSRPAECFHRLALPLAIVRLECTRTVIVPRQYTASDHALFQTCRDADGALAAHYGELDSCYLLVRPDKYIAAIVRIDDPETWHRVAEHFLRFAVAN